MVYIECCERASTSSKTRLNSNNDPSHGFTERIGKCMENETMLKRRGKHEDADDGDDDDMTVVDDQQNEEEQGGDEMLAVVN